MATARTIRRSYDEALAHLGLNLSEASLLALLDENGQLPQSTLSTKLGIRPAATGAAIDALTKRGLLHRIPNPDDRRSWVVELLDTGRTLAKKVCAIDASVRQTLRVGTTRDERQQLASLLVKIQQNLAATGEDQIKNGQV